MTFNRALVRGVALAAVLAVPVMLQAHMKLEKSVPAEGATLTAAPASVELTFSEAPDMAVSKLALHGPTSKAKLVSPHVMGKSLMAKIEGDMPDGAYIVEWQGAGDDGHVQKGELKFSVKRK